MPPGSLAEKDTVDALLQAVANSKMVSVASEKPDNLAQYGLATPAITFTATDDKGGEVHARRREEGWDAVFRARHFAAARFFGLTAILRRSCRRNSPTCATSKSLHCRYI